MIDELDLAFDERADERTEKGRHRRSFVEKRRKKKAGGGGGGGRGKTVVALLMAVLLLGVLGGGAWYGFDKVQGFFTAPDYDGPGTGEVVVQVKPGQLAAEIGDTLAAADVVKSAKAFVEAANDNSRSRNIQAASYKLRKQMKAADALNLMLDPKSKVVNGITIPEGMMSLQIYDKLSKETKIPVAEFKKAAADPVKLGVPAFWFNRTDGKKSTKSIEGFLFPATYEIPPKATAEQILGMMVQHFLQVTQDMKFVDTVQNQRGISPYEALITASIAQAESVHHVDMPKVARVIYNRVYTDKYHCKCLEIDSAINYWLRLQGKDPKDSDVLKQSELNDPKNPYRTHGVNGLTPTPISNPGEDALKGAMDPPTGSWVYFMTVDKKGTMGYGSTDAEYQGLIRQMCKNGVLSGENCPK
ncbi:endolytic transglycosylase MltG [Micromonospora zhanjiangensis]|uniref:Endolytic murein transglycosylase n=1 Tax=Micromonospora zhanjiangensis TaxID=1522057 RepID=A0ABV8KJC8_9ACTN